MINLPSIKFNTESGNKYIYDTYSNNVYPLSNLDESVINKFCDHSENEIIENLNNKENVEEIKRSYKKIQRWHKFEGSFFADRLILMKKDLPIFEIEKAIINCPEICLILTENCNLRCRYCIYSGQYKYERIHTKSDMDFRTAKKALDYFSKHICSNYRTSIQNFIYIGFYGGEAFLKFDLLKQIISYERYLEFPCDKIVHHVTTNGTLFTDEIIDFCIENNFNLHVSLDGPKEYQDHERVFINNTGTFDIVLENILKIKRRNLDYYTEHVNFLVTISPYYEDPKKIIDFFMNHEIFKVYKYSKIPRITLMDKMNLKNDSELAESGRKSKLFDNLEYYMMNTEKCLLKIIRKVHCMKF